MKITIIPMPIGDCIIIRWLDGEATERCIILDSGTSKSYRNTTRNILENIPQIDMWVISHAHDDHIGGVLKYIDDLKGKIPLPECKRWLYNPHNEKTSRTSTTYNFSIPESVTQANKLLTFIKDSAIDINSIKAITGTTINLYGVKITILSPDKSALEIYRSKMLSMSKGSIPARTTTNDYNKTIEYLKELAFEEDTSEINTGSMSLLIEYKGKKLLWLSDSKPSIVCKTLQEMGFTDNNKLYVDLMTLAHHGSKGNTNNNLLDLINCNNIIITADGENSYNLPNKETLARIITHTPPSERGKINFIFSSGNITLKNMFGVDGKQVYDDYNFSISTEIKEIEL